MSSQAENQNRLREIVSILKKHDIVKGLTPEKLRLILEDFGPTFVKLGQIMSMRNDILPAAYCLELEKLRADVNPLPFNEVVSVIEEEYGQPYSELFSEIKEKPLGSASIAQAHYAVLGDGRKMVIKVQRPHIDEIMSKDFSLLRKASKALKLMPVSGMIDFNMVLDELWTVSKQELNFLVEAQNAQEFAEQNKDVKFVSCPQIEKSLTTSRVLVMEYIEGFQIDDEEKLEEGGYDRSEIGTKLADNYIKQVIDDGYFHADPHPGNIRIRDGQIVWIDMGMMGRISNRDRDLIKKAIKTVAARDVNGVKSVILQLGVCNAPINHVKLYADVDNFLEKYATLELGDIDMGKLLEEMLALAVSHHISMPRGVSMLARGIITVEGVVEKLSPEVQVVKVASEHLFGNMRKEFDLKKELLNGAKKISNSGEKAIDLPSLASDLLTNTLKGQTKVNFDVTGSNEPLKKLDAMVTKLVVAIITASLLLGSSVICTTSMNPKTLGIPTLGFAGFIAAVFLGIWLIINSFKKK